MERILIIGMESVAAKAIGNALCDAFEVTTLTPSGNARNPQLTAQRLTPTSLQSTEADTIVFCGGASRSSWDPEFGDLSPEEAWLQPALQKAADSDAQFVFVSSDAVFGGPWVFHNDDNTSFDQTESALAIRDYEQQVEALESTLIVRTNVIGDERDHSGIAGRIVERLQQGESELIDASACGTPIAATDFAMAVVECLKAEVTGYLNIAGAERATIWQLATAVAAAGNFDCDHLVPARGHGRPIERSLRCERLRKELQITTPTLRETAEHIVASIETTAAPIAA